MKTIFLDIDGVLNHIGTHTRCPSGAWGIDEKKVLLLKEIVDATGAKLVVTSTWKLDFENGGKDWKYLLNKIRYRGKMDIYDVTKENGGELARRGDGITNWLNSHDVESFIILDDEMFPDYKYYNLEPYIIKTDIRYGLTKDHVDLAIKMLGREYGK